jgi:hypothetical protein
MLRVISLGWGVQSFALAAMSALGELPPVDAAVHADTTHERRETYEFAERWTPWLEDRGVRVVTVNDARKTVLDRWGGMMLPAYSTWADGRPSGMMRRQCTGDWKIAPIKRWVQKNRKGKSVEMWIGITLDEWDRMRTSNVKYIENVYPFMDVLDRPWARGKVMRWLQENNLEIPVKSSCAFCPYHDHATWREIKLSDNGDWERALVVDRAIRDKRPGYKCYLHAQRIPLEEIDFRNEQDHGQLELWSKECSGMCFL